MIRPHSGLSAYLSHLEGRDTLAENYNNRQILPKQEGESVLKHRFSVCMTLLILLAVSCNTAASGDFEIVDGVLTAYHGPGGDVVIPGGVREIGEGVFFERNDLTSVTIPHGVTAIGDLVFCMCRNLTHVNIPDGVATMGRGAFSRTLTAELDIPEGVTSIGTSAFSYCEKLTSITLPNTIAAIPADAFRYSGLTSITIPENVTNIGHRALASCGQLVSIEVHPQNQVYSSIDGL